MPVIEGKNSLRNHPDLEKSKLKILQSGWERSEVEKKLFLDQHMAQFTGSECYLDSAADCLAGLGVLPRDRIT